MTDTFTFIPIFLLVVFLFYLSNKEVLTSLTHSKRSSKILTEDRNALRLKLQESEALRLYELTRAAEFGRLAQGLFHDLMTPLTSIILNTEQMAESATTHKNLEKALAANNRMMHYVEDIRATLSREEAFRVCDLEVELKSVLHLLSHQARMNNVKISVETSGTLTWYGSPLKLRQVFSNLLSNSLDSFEEKKDAIDKKIIVSLFRTDEEMGIEVSDNGIGIPDEHLAHVFEPFFTTKAFDKGTGIGLTTVKTIVEKDLQGTITLESDPGKRTHIKILFIPSTDPASSPLPPHSPPHHG